MSKKIIDLVTISHDDHREFNRLGILSVRNGCQPFDTVQVTRTPAIYGPDGRFNCGGTTNFTQQFVKYEQEANNSQVITYNSQEFEDFKKECNCREMGYFHYILWYLKNECSGHLRITSDYFILDIYPLMRDCDIGAGPGQSITKEFKRDI